MSLHAVIAVRSGPAAKSRCSGMLSVSQRIDLVTAMLEDMLEELGRSTMISGVYVVTPNRSLEPVIRAAGATAILEAQPAGLNAAFDAARDRLLAGGIDGAVCYLPGDLPLIRCAEIDAAFAAIGPDEIGVAATSDGGTGCLLAPIRSPFPFGFGTGSFERHCLTARRLGLACRVLNAPTLEFDVDWPEDVRVLLASRRAGRSRRALNGVAIAS